MRTCHCNPPRAAGSAGEAALRLGPAVVAGAVLLALTSCNAPSASRAVSVRELELANVIQPPVAQRSIISDTAAIQDLYQPLGPRLGLIQIRDGRQWRRLSRVAPGLGPPPDFSRGIVVGIASHAGLPLDGSWPVVLEAVRLVEGAGLLTADFAGGSFLADTTTYLETAYVEGLAAVLIVDVNGVRFYPELPERGP